MKQSKIYRRLLAVALAVFMVLSHTNGLSFSKALAAESDEESRLTWEKVENNGNGLLFKNKKAAEVFEENYVQNGMVRVSIVLEGASTLDKYSVNNIASNSAAKNYRAEILAKQKNVAAEISKEVLKGEKLDVVWNITLAANIISANVPYDKIAQIRTLLDVKDVIIETQYEPETGENAADPNMATGHEMVGSNYAWAEGYTGAGSKVAIVDTGLDTDHELFASDAFDYAIQETGKTVDLLTEAEVSAVFGELNAAKFISSADGVYLNTKVPFGVNYVDKDLDITHDNDTRGEHGSHVAGIAAANRFVADESGAFKSSLEQVLTQGEAPDAQLIIMKVFGKGGGAYDSDYMVAIEDAIVLGADAVNLSLGSAVAGFTANATYAAILNKVGEATNLVWVNSAGNNSFWAEEALGELYGDDVNFATGGSPGTYAQTLSVASVDNKGSTGLFFSVAGKNYTYAETNDYSNQPLASIAGDYEYVLLDGPGVDDNDHVGAEGDDFLALGSEVVAGKVAMCFRGSSSFFAKANAAVAQGAVAVIIINNTTGVINMNLTGYTYTAPAVSILQADGYEIMNASTKNTDANGNEYYSGTISISSSIAVMNPGEVDYYTMSTFSSFGVPGDLSLKPEITAPGGNIYSVNGAIPGGKGYESMSGTSMAAPQVTGLVAVLAQYIRENNLTAKTGRSARQLAISLLMSTAVPLVDEYYGELYPLIQQGSGLANIINAIEAKSYVTIDSVADTAPASAAKSIQEGKVKVELGQVQSDSVTATFTLHNFSEEDVSYYLDAEFFTQVVYGGYRYAEYMDPLTLAYAWKVDGKDFNPTDAALYDFNGDGVANGNDAQHLLDYCAGLVADEDLYNADMADLDLDGDIDTYDARLAFEMLNNAALNVKAGDSAQVTLTVSGLNEALGGYTNGNYIEGYIYALEGETEDGALGVEHSIPVFGFFGDWSAASMFDKGSYVEYENGLENRAPYMYYATESTGFINGDYARGYIVKYAGDNNDYYFGGNPLITDEVYHPERNALSKESTISSVQYSQIRGAAAGRFFITNSTGKIDSRTVLNYGQSYAAYYYPAEGVWYGYISSKSIGYSPSASDGTKMNLNYQLALEYYVNNGAVDWDSLGEGSLYSMPFVVDSTAPYIVDVEEGENLLTVVAHDNEYIAAVALYTEDGDLLDYYGGLEDIRRGEQHSYAFDLEKLGEELPEHFLIEVYDYAANLSTYKVNLNKEELNNTPISLEMDESLKILRGTTAQITTKITPWGASENLEWTSADPSIATVSDRGLVTGVSVGTTTITATHMDDPSVEASCEVEVFTLPLTLVGALQDEEGAPQLFTWNLEEDTTWHSAGAIENSLTAAAYDWLLDEATYFYQQDFDGYMYKVNIDTLQTEAKSTATTAFGAPMEDIDFPYMFNNNYGMHVAFGVSQSFLLYSTDIMENTFNYGWNFENYLKNYTGATQFVAIAWAGTYNSNDLFLALDDANYLWMLVPDLSTGRCQLGFSATDLSLKYPLMDKTAGNSLIMGDDYEMYLAHFNGSTSEFYRLVYDEENDVYLSTRLGDVGDDVWPAALLMVPLNKTEEGDDTGSLPVAPAYLNNMQFIEVTEEAEEIAAKKENPGGSLNAASGKGDKAEPDKVTTEVTVEVTAEEVTKNGLIKVAIPETAVLVSATSTVEFQAMNDKTAGELTFAFVDLEGVPINGTILKLVFAKESTGIVTVVTTDINDDDEDEQIETVNLGPTEHTIHTYGEPEWDWAEDYSSAKAIFKCTLNDGAVEEVEAAVSFETTEATCLEAGKTVYTATAEFDGKTYTDTQEVEIAALGHDWNEATFTWAEDGKSATATVTCKNDETHTETVDAVITSEEKTPATCDAMGTTTYTATATFSDGTIFTDTKDVEDIEIGGHKWGEAVFTWAEDGKSATATKTCANDASHTETVNAEVTSAVKVAATCEAKGTSLYVATAKFADGTTATATKEVEDIAALGHKWTFVSFTWAEDYSAATASFKCGYCDKEETVNATITSVTTPATTEQEGSTVYTATVSANDSKDGKEHTDTKTVVIPKEPITEWTWTRLGGANRYSTMQVITDEGFTENNTCKTILVATGADFVSALLASGYAGVLNAPLVTAPQKASSKSGMNAAKQEIERLAAAGCEVIILGSTSEIDDTVKKEIEGIANVAKVTRISAKSREALATTLYQKGKGKWNTTGTAILTTGYKYADALSISPYAYSTKTPIFYVQEDLTLRAEEKKLLTSGEFKRVIILGGPAAVSEETEKELKAAGLQIVRLAGSQRYATSAAIVKWATGNDSSAAFQPDVKMSYDKMGVATGKNFADALASVNLLGKTGGVMLLVDDSSKGNKNAFLKNVDELIKANKAQMTKGYIFGGPVAISEDIEKTLNEAVK